MVSTLATCLSGLLLGLGSVFAYSMAFQPRTFTDYNGFVPLALGFLPYIVFGLSCDWRPLRTAFVELSKVPPTVGARFPVFPAGGAFFASHARTTPMAHGGHVRVYVGGHFTGVRGGGFDETCGVHLGCALRRAGKVLRR